MPGPEQVDFSQLAPTWAAIDQSFDELKRIEATFVGQRLLTARAVDEGQTSGHRGYIRAFSLLQVAREHHAAFLSLIKVAGFSPHAPFSLLRPILESGIQVLWLLDPDESLARRTRALRLEVQDHEAEMAYLGELVKTSSVGTRAAEIVATRRANAGSTYRREATILGVDYAQLKRPLLNLVDEIPKLHNFLSGDPERSDSLRFMVAEWRKLSGYQHGKAWPTVLGSVKTEKVRIPGGERALVTASDDAIMMATGWASVVLLAAVELTIRRTISP